MELIAGQFYNVPGMGPMRLKDAGSQERNAQLEPLRGGTYYMSQDRFVGGPLSQKDLLQWAEAFENHENYKIDFQHEALRLREWAQKTNT
jgi:hypothetical protein